MSEQIDLPVPPAPVWDNIPATLATRQQWLLWKFEQPRKGAKKPSKVPYYVQGGRRTGGQGEDSDRQRLATLDVVRRKYERGGWSGIGFAFLPDDGLIGIDIDGAIDPDSGEVSQRCQDIISAVGSFTEYSPSGTGVHIIVAGSTTTNKDNGIGLEVFCGSQYFTFTGKLWPGAAPDVALIDEGVLRRLHKTIDDAKAAARPKASPAARAAPPAQPSHGDDFKRANELGMQHLGAWVPSLFPNAITRGAGYRVTSTSLGRDLQEDLSITPEGIVDFGVADMGDPNQGKRTPIDLVMEWLPAAKAADALKWLAPLVGLQLSGPKPPRANGPASAGSGSGGEGGGPPPATEDPDEEGDDVLQYLIKLRGKPVDCRENVLYCMRHDPTLRGLVAQNEFTELHERSRATPWGRAAGEWDEEDDLMLGEYLARSYGLLIKGTNTLRAGVLMAARVHKFNPVLDLVRSEAWDGIERLQHWLVDCLGVDDSPYVRLVGRCFIMGMVLRAMKPGAKFDYMLILKGPQGARKSTVFKTLATPWFTDNAIRMGDKDSLMALQSIWLAESSELESLNKAETNAIKQFLSATEDLFRPPYGARMVKRPRHAVFGGTTNADAFLKDVTGDRRFWPLEVGDVNIDALKAMRLQLFAEALHWLSSEDPEERRTYPNREQEETLVIPAQERFKMTDVWEDILADYVNAKVNHKTDDPNDSVPAKRGFFSTRELFDHALNIKADRIDGNRLMETRIGNCMKALGFAKVRESSGPRRRGYEREQPKLPDHTLLGALLAPEEPPNEEGDDLPI